jgi:hypothetical protein
MKKILLLIFILCPFILLAQKKRVAIFNSYGNNVSEDIRIAARDALQEGFVKSGKYEVLEREQIEDVQKEFIFQANASDEELQKWAQKTPDADYCCFANITKVGVNYQIACKLIEANSSYKFIFADSKRTKNGEDELIDILEFIANEMFSGRAGKATIPCPSCCKEGNGYVDCAISFSDERATTYEEAISICENKGDGWSLPNREELQKIYSNRHVIINEEEGNRKFQLSDYWSSSKRNNYESYSLNFSNGHITFYSKLEKNPFRCIKR